VRKKREPSLLAGKKAVVCLERNGLSIRVDDVEADKAGLVAADLLMAYRLLRKSFPELITELQPVGGGYPMEVTEDGWAEEGRRLGFKASSG
jgi:hypothetical protein